MELSVFPWISLSFLKIITLNYFLDNIRSIGGVCFWEIMFLWWCHVCLFCHVPNGFVLMPMRVKAQLSLPAFLEWPQLGKTYPEHGFKGTSWVGFGVSGFREGTMM